ncbi:MAG: hypothetical protein ACMXYC_04600 [Candidatus Woesearchaeota archaeon]
MNLQNILFKYVFMPLFVCIFGIAIIFAVAQATHPQLYIAHYENVMHIQQLLLLNPLYTSHYHYVFTSQDSSFTVRINATHSNLTARDKTSRLEALYLSYGIPYKANTMYGFVMQNNTVRFEQRVNKPNYVFSLKTLDVPSGFSSLFDDTDGIPLFLEYGPLDYIAIYGDKALYDYAQSKQVPSIFIDDDESKVVYYYHTEFETFMPFLGGFA